MVVGPARLRGSLNVKRAPVFGEIGGALWLMPVLIVAVPRRWVGPMLRAGVGPSLVRGMVPGVRWRAGPVEVLSAAGARESGEVQAAGQAGARCKACEHTHALLPGFLFARRLDVVDVEWRYTRLSAMIAASCGSAVWLMSAIVR